MLHSKSLFERVRENDQQAEKFNQVELKILATLNYADFFETLLDEVSHVFAVPFVWFSLIRDCEVAHLFKERHGGISATRVSLIERRVLHEYVCDDGGIVLANENMHRYLPLLPRDQSRVVRSVALAPISVDGELVGTLNQADSDASRFAPGLNDVLLERLALKLSICLSNVTAHEKLHGLACLDPLTGLLNRRVMEQALEREFRRAQRYSIPLSVAFIDLNDFKKVNDTYGHEAGDALLQHLARLLQQLSRSTDLVARFAGDEFVLILPQTEAVEAAALMKRMQDKVHQSGVEYSNQMLYLSMCYGLASVPDTAVLSSQQFLKSADERLYTHKKQHKQAVQQQISP